MIINLVTMYEDNYPEMLKKAYVINGKVIIFIYLVLPNMLFMNSRMAEVDNPHPFF